MGRTGEGGAAQRMNDKNVKPLLPFREHILHIYMALVSSDCSSHAGCADPEVSNELDRKLLLSAAPIDQPIGFCLENNVSNGSDLQDSQKGLSPR